MLGFTSSLRQPLIERPGHRSPVDWANTLNCFIFPAVAAYIFGYDLGASPLAVKSLSSDPSDTSWSLSNWELELIRDGAILGAIAVSLLLVVIGNSWGRVAELGCAAICHLVGGIGTFAAGAPWQLMGWRFLAGAGMGLSLHAGTIYIAETCPPQLRGMLISLKEAFLVVGMLMGHLVACALHSQAGGWRSTFLAATPAALLLLSGALELPESPRWLMLKAWQPSMQVHVRSRGLVPISSTPGYVSARAALLRARGRRITEQELESELSGIAGSVREARLLGTCPLRLLGSPLYYKPLLAGLCLLLLQQVTGQPAVMYFSTSILEEAGLQIGQEQLVSGLRLLMTLIAAANVDVWGRRPMLLFGASGMSLSLAVLAAAQLPSAADLLGGDQGVAITCLVSLLVFLCCYQVSLGPLVWVALAEMFPLVIRGPAQAIANSAGLASSLLVTAALPTLSGLVGSMWTYLTFMCLSLVSLVLVWLLVPELKGKTLEEVEATWVGLSEMPLTAPTVTMMDPGPQPFVASLPSVTERSESGECDTGSSKGSGITLQRHGSHTGPGGQSDSSRPQSPNLVVLV